MSVFNYQVKPGSQIYYTTWLFFVLVVETVYHEAAPGRTRVETTYSVGTTRWLRWCFPVIRWLITRNYRDLMSQDVPMRLRRGQLRQWGYAFEGDGSTHSFEKTMDVSVANVRPPADASPWPETSLSLERDLPAGREILLGRSDHLGLRVVREGEKILVFPRMCPHEGANLDVSRCAGQSIACQWHGRQFKPLAALPAAGSQRSTTDFHEIVLKDGTLTVRAISPVRSR
jgi:nitrite reductase/ring-hydroxylating ferredoxin subunit